MIILLGVTLCGHVSIGDYSWIGAGATILNHIEICSNTIVGAGVTVVRNVHHSVVVAGTPSRILRSATLRCES